MGFGYCGRTEEAGPSTRRRYDAATATMTV
jgi:hypothetical protein